MHITDADILATVAAVIAEFITATVECDDDKYTRRFRVLHAATARIGSDSQAAWDVIVVLAETAVEFAKQVTDEGTDFLARSCHRLAVRRGAGRFPGADFGPELADLHTALTFAILARRGRA